MLTVSYSGFVVLVLSVVLLVLCILLVVYPYLIYPLLLRLMSPVEVNRVGDRPQSVTLVFCAFNEAAAIVEKLENIELLKRRYEGLEVLAYNDESSDNTLQLLSARPDLLTVMDGIGRNGKAHGMKQLAAMAIGEILVFTDANVLLAEDAIDHLLDWYRDPSVGGVCGTLHYLNPGESATATVGGAYWRLEEKLKALESRTGNVMGADGSIFSLRRVLYPEFPDTVLDDLTVSMAAVFAGKRLLKAEDVVAYERLVAARSDEFSRKVRIAARAFHTHLYLRPQLRAMSGIDKFKYGSRKLVRWFGGLFLIFAAVLAVVVASVLSPWAGAAAIALIGVAIVVAGRVQHGPVGLVTDIVLALLATLVGVTRAARGETVVTWSPAKSR